MYNIWMRNYPQRDVNMTEEWELEPFETLESANRFIETLEINYVDESWQGHRMYKAKFYAEEVRE